MRAHLSRVRCLRSCTGLGCARRFPVSLHPQLAGSRWSTPARWPPLGGLVSPDASRSVASVISLQKVADVFVVGRLPRVTYNPRDNRGLETALRTYLDDRGTILSVSGATKTGKTVLLRSVAPGALMLSGGTIDSIDDVWNQIAEQLGLWTEQSVGDSTSETERRAWEGGLSAAAISGKRMSDSQSSTSRENSLTRRMTPTLAARRALSGSTHILVIDDFHYVNRDLQLAIVRGVKDLVFDGLGVVLASVPHRAFDAVRVEKEMTGRVTHLNVASWTEDELVEISRLGFRALNVIDMDEELGMRLARESFASPHLMQEFCKRLCRVNGVESERERPAKLVPPGDWQSFFRETAVDTSKAAFDLLRTGPRQRTDRIKRILKDGRETDIYGAVLAAIAHTGPRLEIAYEALRAALREVLASDPPQRHEITRVLDQMTQIAREKVEGEPVMEYDDQYSTLHISDPYFAFYLRWGEGAGNAA